MTSSLDQAVTPSAPVDNQQLKLTSTDGFPSVGSILLKDSATGKAEIMTYSGKNGQYLTGIKRAQFGTIAESFSLGIPVKMGTMMSTVYDPVFLHRVSSIYDGRGKQTRYFYKLNDLLERVEYPDGRWESYTYGPAGNIKTKTEGAQSGTPKVTTYTYDANGRVTKVSGG